MLEGKVVFVTGASGDIGKAIASMCAENGAQVVINYNTNEQAAIEVVNDITNKGYKAVSMKGDISKEEDVKDLFLMINNKFGRLDILVNNAGVMLSNPIMLTTNEEFDQTISVNCNGLFLCTKHVIKMMVRQKYGKIINIASIIGIEGSPAQAVYSGSKAFVIGFTRSAAKELGRFGITVNAVAPGFIDTAAIKNVKKEIVDKYIMNNTLGRLGTPDDVAKVVLFLASELGNYVTGQVITIDGGQII
jgi:3-oxoacyl-[acyl-carrier protein] reductase